MLCILAGMQAAIVETDIAQRGVISRIRARGKEALDVARTVLAEPKASLDDD